jgi:hypothetical protein
MLEYVKGFGDYWIRLIEQMVPATTIWNTGVKIENSIFHRQKFVWRRQPGCKVINVPCQPCQIVSNIFTYDCPVETVECSKYPWAVNPRLQQFGAVMGQLLTNYVTANGYTLNDCVLNSVRSEWFVDIRINDVQIISYPFFNGIGYSNPPLSSPTVDQWDAALIAALDMLDDYGYDYYLTDNDTVVIYNQVCSLWESGINFKLNVGINFEIFCS